MATARPLLMAPDIAADNDEVAKYARRKTIDSQILSRLNN